MFGAALDLEPFAWRMFARIHAVTGDASHGDLAGYLTWVLNNARVIAPEVIHIHLGAEVTALRREAARWRLTTAAGHSELFDGVVITSPGDAFANRFELDAAVRDRVFDARTYWATGRQQANQSIVQGKQVAILGAGGAAAAVCLDLLRPVSPDMDDPGGVVLVAPQPTLFTRGESRFETELLTSATWSQLPRELRRQVSERLLSGVVFGRVLGELEALEFAPAFLIGRALAVRAGTRSAIELWCLTPDERIVVVDAETVVDATGFNAMWFLRLLEQPLAAMLGRIGISVLAEKLDDHLRLHVDAEWFGDEEQREPILAAEPGLHVPFLAGGAQPPGPASLLQLGGLAEKICCPTFVDIYIYTFHPNIHGDGPPQLVGATGMTARSACEPRPGPDIRVRVRRIAPSHTG